MGSRHILWYTLLLVAASILLAGCAAKSTEPSPETTATAPVPSPTMSPATGSPVPAASPATAATTAPAATPEEVRSGRIGDTLRTKEWRMTLDKVERPGKTLTWSQPDGKAQASDEYVLVYLAVQKTKEEKGTLSFTDFQLLSREGDVYRAMNCCQPYAASKKLESLTFASAFAPEDSSSILLVFDAPSSAKGLTLIFTAGKGFTWQLD